MSYGPTGVEYIARECEVMDHDVITCLTTEGVGQNLVWQVIVQGQTSELSSVTTSYAFPVLLSANPLTGFTEGGATITIIGENLATFQRPFAFFDDQEITIFYTAGQDIVFATVPEGFGENIELYLVVGEAKTNSFVFSYRKPVITSVNSRVIQGREGQ